MTIVIKDNLNEDDLLDFAYLEFLFFNEFRPRNGPQGTQKKTLEKVLNWSKEKKMLLWLARVDSQAAGITYGRELYYPKNIFHSEGVYVLPEFRKMGVARALKTAQIETAKIRGYNKIICQIAPDDNLPSIKLHESLGFEVSRDREYLRAKLSLE